MSLSSKSWVLITTVLVISVLFIFYFLVYVKNNEEALRLQNNRVLIQIGSNLNSIYAGLKHIAKYHPTSTKSIESAKLPDSIKLEGRNVVVAVSQGRQRFTYTVANSSLFENDLVLRKDIFDFIAIYQGTKDRKSYALCYTNQGAGELNIQLSIDSLLSNHPELEVELGYARFKVFSAAVQSPDPTKDLFVVGFVNKNTFNASKRNVSVAIITASLILAILLLLSLPVLKLRVMSNFERLYAKDVLISGGAILVGATILVVMFLYFLTNYRADRRLQIAQLSDLHRIVSSNFVKELESTVQLLSGVKWHKVDNPTDSMRCWQETLPKVGLTYYNSVFLCNKKGSIYGLDDNKSLSIEGRLNLAHRNYVAAIINNTPVMFKDSVPIAVESIRSVTDGSYEIGVGMNSGIPAFPVSAVSYSLVSVMEPVLEPGYGYCLFDQSGKTWFHSDMNRNLNENIIDETGHAFLPYMQSGDTLFTSLSYHGNDHYMLMKKLDDLEGLYLATFVNKEQINSSNTLAIYGTLHMELSYLLFILVVYLILYFSFLRRSKLRKSNFMFAWLKPYCDEGLIYYRHCRKLVNINLVLSAYVVLAWLLWSDNADILIHTLLVMGMLSVGLGFCILMKASIQIDGLASSLTQHRLARLYPAIGLAILGLFLAGRFFLYDNSFRSTNTIVDIALLLLLMSLVRRIQRKKREYKNVSVEQQFNMFRWYQLTFVLLLAALPTLIFFSINYNVEKQIAAKHQSYELIQLTQEWRKKKQARLVEATEGDRIQRTNVKDLDGMLDAMEDSKLQFASSLQIMQEPNRSAEPNRAGFFEWWYGIMRFSFDKYTQCTSGFLTNSGSDWVYGNSQVCVSRNGITYKILNDSHNSFFNLLIDNWWYFLLCLFSLFLLISHIMKFCIHKIYGYEYKTYVSAFVKPIPLSKLADKLCKQIDDAKTGADSFNNSILVGVNASHLFEVRDALQKRFGDHFACLDLHQLAGYVNGNQVATPSWDILIAPEQAAKNLVDALKGKEGAGRMMVYIEHFEFAYNDVEMNRLKLNLLTALVDHPSIYVVISSEISPVKLYSFYEDRIQLLESNLPKGSDKYAECRKVVDKLQVDYSTWLHLFGGFYRVTVPFEAGQALNEEGSQSLIAAELDHGSYLRKLNSNQEAVGQVPDEDNILSIQETSYPYYFSIWNALTKEERYIVYDIAKDGFLNTNNVDGITDLLHKGILRYDHSLRLMNLSFGNFVLSKVSSDEALERELEMRHKGSWNTMSGVLMILIASLIIFVSFGKVSLLDDINTLIGSVGTVLALFLRVSGILSWGKIGK